MQRRLFVKNSALASGMLAVSPLLGNCNVTLERYIQSDRSDTCFQIDYRNGICLRKNVGIKNFSHSWGGNHGGGVGYILIEGPTF